MIKKILISATILLSASAFPVMAGNMGYYYPAFSAYLPVNPTYQDMQRYIQEYEDYARGCEDDINRILREKQQAYFQVQSAIQRYNTSHIY